MSTFDGTEPTARPTRTSGLLAVAGTATLVAVLLVQVGDIFWPVVLGAVGAALFGVSCWLFATDGFGTLSWPLVSILTLPVALGLFGSSAVAGLFLASSLFPVPDSSLFSTTTLTIASHIGVVFGSTLAILGVTLGRGNVVTPTTLKQYSVTTFLTAVVPGVVAAVLVVEALLFGEQGPLSIGGELAGLVWTWLTAAEPTQLDLAGFLFVVGLAVTGVLAAVVVLPVTELRTGGGRRGDDSAAVDRLRTRLIWLAGIIVLLQLLAVSLELHYAESGLDALLGSTLSGVLQSVTMARSLRFLLLGVAVLALAGATAGFLVRRLARQSSENGARLAGPFVGGTLVTLIAAVVSDPVYEAVFDLVLESLPPATEADVRQLGTEMAGLYGTATFTIALGFALVGATLGFIISLRLGLFFGYLSGDAPGYAIAGTGLFLGVVAAGTLGAPAWLVFGGLLCTLFVWGIGQFGTTLGREMGTEATTRPTEFVHAGGTLIVGLLGVVAASLLVSRVDALWTLPSATTSVALVALAVGLVSFVVALR